MSTNNVFLFVPNLISYARIGFYFGGFLAHTLGYWQLCVFLYYTGFNCDLLDGLAARRLKQSTQFGSALDMIEDRVATTGLCLILAQLYPRFTLVFILLITLDISSHYSLVYLTALQGRKSHKNQGTQSEYWLLNLYYRNAHVLRLLTAGNELVLMCLYICYYTGDMGRPWLTWNLGIWRIILLVSLPFCALEQIKNVLQLKSTMGSIAAIDAREYAD